MSPARLERRLAELAQCASAGGREALGGYSIEGLRLVERALRAGASLEWVVASEELLGSQRSREQDLVATLRARPDLELLEAPAERLTRLLGGRTFGALLGFVRRPHEPALVADPGAGPWLVVQDAEDPGNVGALVRTAHATGAAGLVALGTTDPYHPKAVRTSMGSLFRLPVLRRRDASAWLAEARELGLMTLGAVARGGIPLPEFQRAERPLALHLGSEAFGLPQDLAGELEALVSIPQREDADSLSINAAAAILCHALAPRGVQ